MENIKTIEVKPGDRIDTIAYRVYGDSYSYTKIVKLNPNINIFDIKPGTQLRI